MRTRNRRIGRRAPRSTPCALVDGYELDCDLAQRPTFFLAREPADVERLRREAVARQRIGLEATFVDAAALLAGHGVTRPGAVRSEVSYELDPWKLTVALLESATRLGTRIYDRTALAVEGAPPSPARSLVTTAGGAVRCRDVVFATGYEAPEQFPALRSLCEMKTTFALMSTPVQPASRLWPERAQLWEMAEPYFYARTTAGDRVMIGGEDEPLMSPAARDAALPAKRERLLAMLGSLLPDLEPVEAERCWGATFAETAGRLPVHRRARGRGPLSLRARLRRQRHHVQRDRRRPDPRRHRGSAASDGARPFSFDRVSARAG